MSEQPSFLTPVAETPEGYRVQVLVPLALPLLLDYVLPHHVEAGTWVRVQVGRNLVNGVVAGPGTGFVQNLKRAEILQNDGERVPPLHDTMLGFYRWMARYTLSAPGEPLRVALPQGKVPELPKLKPGKDKLAQAWKLGVQKHVVLSESQAAAVAAVKAKEGTFAPFLLDGVTGSGKTEVYFELLEDLLTQGRQVLVMVPEIALTPQWKKRFKQRFGVAPLVWHSGLAAGARREVWWRVVRGEPVVVVGARSALFLPWQSLGLVVVDEEHDPSYKQGEGFVYHGRDAAIQMAHMWKCPVVLASATPSLETWQAALEGRYEKLVLEGRHGGALMPHVKLVDMRGDKLPRRDFLSEGLREEVFGALTRKEQVLLFLNRRGNAPLLVCSTCGTRRECPNCDATLVVHGDETRCHHCGYREPLPDRCPTCDADDLRAYGPGTRAVAQEVQRLWPEARVVVADSDVASTTNKLTDVMDQLVNREADVVVGTQMMTKGHHLPDLTLVGVVDADMGLAHGSSRAAERTYQMMVQVAGRAGRVAGKNGRVVVQTFNPEHPLFEAFVKGDRDKFYAQELAARKAWGDPPFGRAMAITIKGLDEELVVQGARGLAQAFAARSDTNGLRLLGPAPAIMRKVRNVYRWRILIKGPRHNHGVVKEWLESFVYPRGVEFGVDVDPEE
jgi:primosomal protein N' (replication factor Y) (superfamily II helicase)